MQTLPLGPTVAGTPDTVTGQVYYSLISPPRDGFPVLASWVRFGPGARTGWHRHALGETLHVTRGVALVQLDGDDVAEVRAGESVEIPAGRWHWHGAPGDQFMEHIAIGMLGPDGQPAEWDASRPVSDVATSPGERTP